MNRDFSVLSHESFISPLMICEFWSKRLDFHRLVFTRQL